jgi:hypothetical protein
VIFCTHSPFILSDIPGSNILKLIKGIPEPEFKETFGANTHAMLKDSFFLSKGSIGAFARQEIQTILDKINKNDQLNLKEKERILGVINLVGDPFLKEKMLKMFYQKFDREKRIFELESELERLKKPKDDTNS